MHCHVPITLVQSYVLANFFPQSKLCGFGFRVKARWPCTEFVPCHTPTVSTINERTEHARQVKRKKAKVVMNK